MRSVLCNIDPKNLNIKVTEDSKCILILCYDQGVLFLKLMYNILAISTLQQNTFDNYLNSLRIKVDTRYLMKRNANDSKYTHMLVLSIYRKRNANLMGLLSLFLFSLIKHAIPDFGLFMKLKIAN